MPTDAPRTRRGGARRGGARPGAGAPRGNRNALKHGRRSRALARLYAQFPPATRELLHLALTRAAARAVQDVDRDTPELPARARNRVRQRAWAAASLQVLQHLAAATRLPDGRGRERAIVHALRPWLDPHLDPARDADFAFPHDFTLDLRAMRDTSEVHEGTEGSPGRKVREANNQTPTPPAESDEASKPPKPPQQSNPGHRGPNDR
ncbi:MAG: hypothetical protein R3C39_03460 [Dehalococcoidia bacterium]